MDDTIDLLSICLSFGFVSTVVGFCRVDVMVVTDGNSSAMGLLRKIPILFFRSMSAFVNVGTVGLLEVNLSFSFMSAILNVGAVVVDDTTKPVDLLETTLSFCPMSAIVNVGALVVTDDTAATTGFFKVIFIFFLGRLSVTGVSSFTDDFTGALMQLKFLLSSDIASTAPNADIASADDVTGTATALLTVDGHGNIHCFVTFLQIPFSFVTVSVAPNFAAIDNVVTGAAAVTFTAAPDNDRNRFSARILFLLNFRLAFFPVLCLCFTVEKQIQLNQ